MHYKFIFPVIVAWVTGVIFAENTEHHWELKDGTGALNVKDSIGTLNGKIVTPENVTWAREDDRGFFLNFRGGHLEMPHSETMCYREGFIAIIRFSPDFSQMGNSPWMGLFSKGLGYANGYTVMLKSDGSRILIGLSGIKPDYKTVPAKLESNREYTLILALGENRLRLVLDGQLIMDVPAEGSLTVKEQKFYLGGSGGYKYFGNLYSFEIGPYQVEKAKKLIPEKLHQILEGKKDEALKFPPLKLPDPPGTVRISDFARFMPAPLMASGGRMTDRWIFRSEAKMVTPDSGILHPPAGLQAPGIEFDPGLQGQYDLYLGARAVAAPTSIIINLGDDYYWIDAPPGTNIYNYNFEQPIVRNIEMKEKKLRLLGTGMNFYLGYLKLIPSAGARAVDYPPLPGFQVRKTEKPTLAQLERTFQAEIDDKIASGYFIERLYADEKQMPAITPESKKRGYTLSPRNWMDLVFPNSVPDADHEHLKLSMNAAKGEFESAAFIVHALSDLKQLVFSQKGEFKDADGKSIAIQIQPSIVEYGVKRTTNYQGKSEFMRMPYYLEPSFPVDVKAGESRCFFVTAKVPDHLPSGLYTGKFTLEVDSQTEEISLQLRVHDFKLENVDEFDFGFWTDFGETEQAVRAVEDMADFNMTSIVVNSEAVLNIGGGSLDTLKIDFDRSILPKIAETMRERKMNGRIYLCSSGLWYKSRILKEEERDAGYGKLVEQLNNYAARNNWPPIIFFSFDEVLSRPNLLPAFMHEIKLQKSLQLATANDHIWYKTARPYQKQLDEISPFIDIFICRFNTRSLWYVDDWESMMATAKAKNARLVAYNSDNAVTFAQPEAMRFAAGWFFHSSLGRGCSGQMFWTYFNSFGNPYNDLDGADWTYMTPEYDWRKGGPILNYLALREGIDDLRYYQTLEKMIATAKARNIDSSTEEKLLTQLSSSFDMRTFKEKSVYFNSFWDKSYEKDGKRYASGRLNLPNGWTFEDYEQARAHLTEAILQLQNKLK